MASSRALVTAQTIGRACDSFASWPRTTSRCWGCPTIVLRVRHTGVGRPWRRGTCLGGAGSGSAGSHAVRHTKRWTTVEESNCRGGVAQPATLDRSPARHSARSTWAMSNAPLGAPATRPTRSRQPARPGSAAERSNRHPGHVLEGRKGGDLGPYRPTDGDAQRHPERESDDGQHCRLCDHDPRHCHGVMPRARSTAMSCVRRRTDVASACPRPHRQQREEPPSNSGSPAHRATPPPRTAEPAVRTRPRRATDSSPRSSAQCRAGPRPIAARRRRCGT